MRQLTPNGQAAISNLAAQSGFSQDAVLSMLDSVVAGNGMMAQFSHPEFGGSGQWMRGGMIMLSDMFNNILKGRVEGLCNALSDLIGSGASPFQGPVFAQPQDWWPAELGFPNSTGAQNNVRYAYFANARRLAIESNGQLSVYDTLDHQIGGFGQQQSFGGSLTFTSQYGLVDLSSLPLVNLPLANLPQVGPGGAWDSRPDNISAPVQQPVSASFESNPPQASAPSADVIATIEKLADLHARGVLSEQEFTLKKTDLLARL